MNSIPDARPALDDPIGSALRSRHAALATADGRALRYPADVAPFGSLPFDATEDDWAALARLAAGDLLALFVPNDFEVAPGWETRFEIGLTQMTDDDVVIDMGAERDADVVDLGSADVAEMLRLTALTRPGPFLPRTVELGGYVGVAEEGRLLAMAGRRLSLDGWVEVSAVCTDPAARGRGYAAKVVGEVVRGIRRGGDRAFLHVAEGNPARAVYERLGFVARRDSKVVDVTPA